MNGQIRRIYGLREGVEDAGAAQEAIGELADLVENWQTMDQSRVKAMLFSWFKQNETVIRQALGLDGTDMNQWHEAKLPDSDEDEFIAQEGGPGSGRKPGPALPPGPPVGGDPMAIGGGGDEVYPMDGDPDEGAPPSPGASGLPSDVMKKLRDVIQSLESLVPDEDPIGDDPPELGGDDDGEDDDGDDAPSPPKKDKAKKPPKSKDKPDDVGEARRRRR